MAQIIYFITKENEIIFAQNFKYDYKEDAQEDIKTTYKDIKTRDNIKDIEYTANKLKFTDTAENDSDEIHTITIQ